MTDIHLRTLTQCFVVPVLRQRADLYENADTRAAASCSRLSWDARKGSAQKPMTRIRTLKANVTREQAIEQFVSSGLSKIFRNYAFGSLRSVAEFYVPFRMFRARIVNRGIADERLVALDAVAGTLDLFQFDHLPNDSETTYLATRNCAGAELDNGRATELLIAKLRRVLYSRGFFRMRELSITAHPLDEELFIPYWLGFRGSDGHARIAVLDAVRRRLEGAKVRRLVENWIASKQ